MGVQRDKSYGIIPLRRADAGWELFVIRHRGGHWAFPKGHPDKGESPRQTAERELTEESALRVVSYLMEDSFAETYKFRHKGNLIIKTVIYYVAEVQGEVELQLDEVVDFKWVPLDRANEHLTFAQAIEMSGMVLEELRARERA